MIVALDKAIGISKKLRKEGRLIVLAGGCFDILHTGHIKFLRNSKKQGDILFVLLESDANVSKLKGKGRPINPQEERAEVLSEIKSVDYVVLLPEMKSDKDYDRIVSQINPTVIATTQDDPGIEHKKRQGRITNAKLKFVIERVKDKSTTDLNKKIEEK